MPKGKPSKRFSVTIPVNKLHDLRVVYYDWIGPTAWDATDNYIVNYTIDQFFRLIGEKKGKIKK